MLEFPKEMETWRKRSAWLLKGFQASKTTVSILKEILDFFNGDTSDQVLVHWCIPNSVSGKPCCKDDAESLNKGISLLTSFLTKGYAVPLLYRMKHYGPAASFIRVGCCLHSILPRILNVDKQALSPADRPGSDLSNIVDTLLGTEHPKKRSESESNKNLSPAEFEALVGKLLDEDTSFAAQNGARCQMVQKEISQPAFQQSSMLIDALVQRMERGFNFFLRRTSILNDLSYFSHANPEHEEHKAESSKGFLKVIRGELGQELISDYRDFLKNGFQESVGMGLDGTQSQLNLIFQLVVSCMTDLHRRMVQEFMVPPFTVLRLADADPATFATVWNNIRQRFLDCECCVDAEFTTPILRKYSCNFSIPPTQTDIEKITEIQEFLVEISIWSPLTSDAVEIVNGQIQWALSRRGKGTRLLQRRSAVEISILSRAVKQHAWVQQQAGDKTLPSKAVASGIRRLSGIRSCNQHSLRNSDSLKKT